jgi:signal transduction histidine kinase
VGESDARPLISASAIDSFSREVRRVDTYDALVEAVRAEVSRRFGLTNAWLYVCEQEDAERLVLVASAGPRTAAIREIVPVIPRAGDPLVEALLRAEGPVVIPDAQAGPYPEVTRLLGNRTVVNMPMSVVDHALGILGCGTFGDDGVVALDEDATRYLGQIANIASVVLARMVVHARDRERAELQGRLAQHQRVESLGLLAGGVAHDFNNLLTVIHVSARLLLEGELTEEQRADVELILAADESARQLTQKLLMLGQRQTPKMEMVDFAGVVDGCVRLVRRLLPASFELDVIAGTGLPRVRADRVQLEQVLMNLVLNARDAMPAGGRIVVETEQVLVNGDYRRAHPWAKPGRYVLMTVSDTGIGMAPETAERVFEPFFTTKGPGEGSGLGLAVVWGVVQQHGGMVHCYSEPGLGSSFKVYLPAAEQQASLVGSKIVGAVPRGTEHILVADDQPYVLRLLERVLVGAGYRVTTVRDGVEAVQAASPDIDLYVLDAVMPRISGREACERIRQQHPGARFLFASGYGMEALPASFLEDMGIAMISKPMDPDTLLRAVRAALDVSSRGA